MRAGRRRDLDARWRRRQPAGRGPATCAGGTVVFSATLAGATIPLDSEITIDKALTIDGTSAPGVTVDGQDITRIFNVGFSNPMSLTALALMRGHAESGAAVYAIGSQPLVFKSVIILSSTMTNTVTGCCSGGAITTNGKLSMTGGLLQGNQCLADRCLGGAISALELFAVGTQIISNTSTEH